MTYNETLDWMFTQLPMYQEKGKISFNGKLGNIKSLSAHLDYPEKKFKSVHIAGTNGKGSSSHMLASILQEAGYKVGLYTSPHLKDFRERIRINGKMVSKEFVVNFITSNSSLLKNHRMNFFEMTVGMAFDYFAKSRVDIAIIEVGLGGRLDSTNIIMPEISLITNIGYDHITFLGNKLTDIAVEKAGIIKEGIPVVISEYQEEIAETFKVIVASHNSEMVYAENVVKEDYKTSLLGNYQSKNVKGVVATVKQLYGFDISEEHIKKGLAKVVENTGLMGRWQVIQDNPRVVCDTAHNTEGLALVLKQLQEQEFTSLHIVLGFVSGKNLDVLLPLFPKNATYYFARPDIPRGLDVIFLKTKATVHNLKGEVYASVGKALKTALFNSIATDFIFVGGSTFVVAEVV